MLKFYPPMSEMNIDDLKYWCGFLNITYAESDSLSVIKGKIKKHSKLYNNAIDVSNL